MITAVYILKGNMAGEVGTIHGDLDNLNPAVTHVYVTFPHLNYPRDFRRIALTGMRRAKDWEIERCRDAPPHQLKLGV